MSYLSDIMKVTSSEFQKPWLKNRVQEILIEYKHTRDNDEALSVIIWESQLQTIHARGLAYNFFFLYSRRVLASSEAICRQRRLLQEKNPALRGENWEARHAKAEEVKQKLREDKIVLKPEEADNE